MKRWPIALVGLAVVSLAALVAAVLFVMRPRATESTGEVGRVIVYGQLPIGPVALTPGRRQRLPRPQDLAFHVQVQGTGPRFVRLELEAGGERTVLFEERLVAPHDDYLDYTMRLDEAAPDEATLVVVVEAPERASAVVRYPLALVGRNTRFWSTASDAGSGG